MPLTLVASAQPAATTLHLRDGLAECMGDGLFILFQTDCYGAAQSVVLSEADLRAMLATI